MAGIAIAAFSSLGNAVHLMFPLAAGFAIIGPFVAIGLYEMSRRRERGLPVRWRDAFATLGSPASPSILAFGLLLFAIFAAWIWAADLLYVWLYGPNPPAAAGPFLRDVLTSDRGWTLIVVGGLVGFCFAALALCISVVSIPLMLDRDVGLVPALEASLRLTRANPLAVALWGLIVATALVIGSLPLFFGLAVVMPVLGHATWRFYRKAVERDPAREVVIEAPRGESFGGIPAPAAGLDFPRLPRRPPSEDVDLSKFRSANQRIGFLRLAACTNSQGGWHGGKVCGYDER